MESTKSSSSIYLFRYLLESIPLSPPDVIHIFGILKRIARHSLNSTWILANTPRLLSVIVNNFLPHNTTMLLSGENVDQLTTAHGVPLSHAMRFMKVRIKRKFLKEYKLLLRAKNEKKITIFIWHSIGRASFNYHYQRLIPKKIIRCKFLSFIRCVCEQDCVCYCMCLSTQKRA